MDRLRRSFRDSFRRRGSRGSNSGLSGSAGDEANKPQLWSQDEASVRAGTCSFNVKYLGCVEVFDSRGMQVCEDALKILRSSRRSPIRGILYVSGDGLRVVDAENKGLVVDQTIEKVSFCAPDRNHERGFAYVCRDGTTRRWMCHGFHAVKESGERLSHAVGCAFAVCLEKKQRRDRDATNQGILDAARASDSNRNPTQAQPFRRNDFRRATLPERRQDPQNVKPTEPPPVKPTSPPSSAVARPKANQELLFTREGSLRLSQEEQSPFKRSQYYSLRLTEQGTKTITPPPHGSGISTAPVISPVPEERSATSLAQQQLQGLHIGGQCNVNGTQATLLDRTFSDTPANAPAGSSLEGGQNQEANRSRADEWLATLASNANAPPGVGNPQMPTSSTSSYDMNGDVDIFGHRSFGNVPRSQSLIAGNSKPLGAGLATQRSLDVGDPFEQRWDALGRISPRSTESTPAKRSYNPFTEESTLVNL